MFVTTTQVLYSLIAISLAVVGFNTLVLAVLYLRHRNNPTRKPGIINNDDLPAVLVQLPIYNERHVAERLIRAAGNLDYPHDKLTIQVLDDSDDETTAIAGAAIKRLKQQGIDIHLVRRTTRTGFKAGALAYGMRLTDHPYIAIFDADFVPRSDYLRDVIPHLAGNDRLGMVQTRWAHINAGTNSLTRAEALALDAHFVVEQTARHRSGLLMNFSGTAGTWRRLCITDSGGWQHDTLSEDIDLSYRAQMRGWQFLYLPDVGSPAEVPPLMMGFKRQQSRWATGTVQCLRKLGGTLVMSNLTAWQKIQGIIHLGGYFLHPLMLALLLLTLPLMLTNSLSSLPLAGLSMAMLGSPIQAIISQQYLYRDWKSRLAYYPVFMMMGIGISVSNTAAVMRGLRGKPVEFRRTPKFMAESNGAGWMNSIYLLPNDATTWMEFLMAGYALGLTILSIHKGMWTLTPFMLLYTAGFAYTAILSVWQSQTARRIQRQRQSRALDMRESVSK